MASVRKKGDAHYCTFRYHGKRYYFTVGSVSENQAQPKASEVDETLDHIDRGRLAVPDGVLLQDFVACGGKAPVVSVRPESTTFRKLADHYLATHANGALESTTLSTAKIHLNHIGRSLGDRFRIQAITRLNLQEHVDRRRKKGVAVATVKKEIATLRACWN
jgi:hypothetical protein